jgi:NADH dehydrogenase
MQTIAMMGAEQLYLGDAVMRVAKIVGRPIAIFPAPVWFHYVLAQICEWTMKVPLVAKAQVRILSEGVTEPAHACDPNTRGPGTHATIHSRADPQRLPEPGPFALTDLRCCLSHAG